MSDTTPPIELPPCEVGHLEEIKEVRAFTFPQYDLSATTFSRIASVTVNRLLSNVGNQKREINGGH